MSIISSDKFRIILGVGQTGTSVARFLHQRGLRFAACDTRESGAALDAFRREFPFVELRCGALDGDWLRHADELILSPGIAKDQPAILEAVEAGAHLLGDIDLFAREISAPVVGITGSNGKSTVTTLLGQMARDAGLNVEIGGNIGIPVLDLLAKPPADLYVLELSSFQLETVSELQLAAATVLNMSPDHMDRYPSMQSYHLAKHRIYRRCRQAVFNREDPLSRPLVPNSVKQISFGLNAPDLGQYGLLNNDGEFWLARGHQPLLNCAQLRIRGQHNYANALAALALGETQGLSLDSMLATLTRFEGLEHRCQWVAEHDGVSWFNDSKGTNVGATLAAIEGFGATLKDQQKIILIAGGQAKGQSFSELQQPAQRYLRALVLIGEDADQIAGDLQFDNSLRAESLSQAIELAKQQSQPGDLVLLSPACASFDMFASYEDRGRQFVARVREALA